MVASVNRIRNKVDKAKGKAARDLTKARLIVNSVRLAKDGYDLGLGGMDESQYKIYKCLVERASIPGREWVSLEDLMVASGLKHDYVKKILATSRDAWGILPTSNGRGYRIDPHKLQTLAVPH